MMVGIDCQRVVRYTACIWSHHRLIHALCAALSMHSTEHMNMPRATDCQVVIGVCQSPAELS